MRPKKAPLSFTEKVQKEMPEFAAEVAALSSDAIDSRLAELSRNHEEVQEAKRGDEELQEAKNLSRALGEPYGDAIKVIRTKAKYLVELQKGLGK
jgi:hypothetical protein